MSEQKLLPTINLAFEKGASYCAYQERCQKDVRNKLFELKLDKDQIEEVIYLLIKDDFLNEERYAKTYARSKFNYNKWGRNKIRLNLKQKEISDRNIVIALKEIEEETYFKVLEYLIIKKYEALKDKNSWAAKQKVTNYLMHKGFEFELIKEFL